MGWLEDIGTVAANASNVIVSAAGVYTDLITARSAASLQRAQIDAQLATARAQIAAGQAGAAAPGSGSSAAKPNWMLIGGALLVGGLLVWRMAR